MTFFRVFRRAIRPLIWGMGKNMNGSTPSAIGDVVFEVYVIEIFTKISRPWRPGNAGTSSSDRKFHGGHKGVSRARATAGNARKFHFSEK